MKLRIPISIRFLLALTGILIAQALAAVWVAADRIKISIIAEKEGEMRIYLDSLHQANTVLNENNIFLNIDDILVLLNKDPSIEAALIFDPDNKVVGALEAASVGKPISELVSRDTSDIIFKHISQIESSDSDAIWHDYKKELIHAVSPIGAANSKHSNALNGHIYIRLNMLDTKENATERLVQALIPVAFIILFTALFSTWFFHRYVLRRINDLRVSTNTFTETEQIELPSDTTNDELFDLQSSLDRLMTQVQRKSRLEQEMRESQQKSEKLEQKLSMHWQKTPMGVIEWDKEFRVVAWNPAAEKIFGYSAEEALGQHASFIVPDVAKAYVEIAWQQLVSQEQAVNNSNYNLTKSGEQIVCDWINTPLSADGKVIGAASFVQDNTSEHEALQSLVDREQEQSEILNSMTDAVISIDDNGLIKTFNRAAQELFGYQAYELIDENIRTLFPDEQAKFRKQIEDADSKGADSNIIALDQEAFGKHKDGEMIPVHLSISELPTPSDGIRRFIGCCRDLRQKKQQEEVIRRSQKMDSLGKLTGGIAHDFNNILGVVTGYTELLLSKVKDEPTLKKYAEEIKTASVRGTKLTSKLLASSKKKYSVNEQVDVNEVLLNQKEILAKTLPPNTKLIYELQERLWPVFLDGDDLQDALLNLCINSVHSMGNDGKLCVFTYNTALNEEMAKELNALPGDYVVLCVTDTGCGMDDETKERIFEPFFSTKGDKGTGLGLSQVFGFVERSHGAIKVDSALNEGSQFSIFFPRLALEESAEARTKEVSTSSKQSSEKGKESILVVDDEPALRSLCEEVLSSHGYQVDSEESGEGAIERLEKQRYDLLLSDIVMPNMDGYELASKAKQLQPTIKIQLMSGFDPEKHQDYGDEKLRKSILAKPYTPFILLKQVRYILDQDSPSN